MKKSLIIALAVMAGAVFNTAEAAGKKKKKECFETVEFNMSADSLNNSMPKVDLKNAVDTVSYAIGMSQTQGMKEYLMKNLGVDTTYLDEFYKGIIVGVDAGDDKKKTAYYAGIQIGQQISNQMLKGINHELFGNDSTKTISLNNFIAAFISGISGKGGLMTIEQAQNMVMTVEQAQNVLQVKIPAIKAKAMEAQYGENKKAGEKYLAEYAKKAGVKKLANGVLYRVIKEGKGEIPNYNSCVRVHYEGKTIDGKVFDSSYKTNEPIVLCINQVISGWAEALTHMPVGSVWEVVIPADQAYGGRETSEIKPYSTLVFKIELLGIEK